MGRYDDIINMEHHVSEKHPRMKKEKRAAQFSPFAALTGYEEIVKETARTTQSKPEISDDEKTEIDSVLKYALDHRAERPKIRITYFKEDGKKSGGSVETVFGIIRKVDVLGRKVLLEDGLKISIDDLLKLDTEA